MSNLCAFSTSNNSYIASAVASLLTVRRWNPGIPLYIIGAELNDKSKSLLKRHNINFIEINLDKIFYKSWDYPKECYYVFAGPEIFNKLGFTYSLYIDGDIYCNKVLEVDLRKVKMLAGVKNGPIKKIMGDDWETVREIWGESRIKERIQSGVLFFNNKKLADLEFLKKIGHLFSKAVEQSIPRKGDDSLFALFQYVYSDLEYTYLPEEYNFIESNQENTTSELWLNQNESLIKEAFFYHFTSVSPKPWNWSSSYPNYTCKYFTYKWRQRLIDNFNSIELKQYYPQIAKTLRKDHLRFYWWPSKNVGDLITPYFLSKICKVDLEEHSIDEKEIFKIESKKNIFKKLPIKFLFGKDSPAKYCVSTGSIIRLCGKKALIYGSGIRSKNQEVKKSHIRCVRGPLTRARFIDSGYECPPVYGDPGLLLPRYYHPKKPKKYNLGVIPHFTEYETVKKLYAGEDDVFVINMGSGNLEKVIDAIFSCKATVSSSLHGLVFSHAYKVPTCRIIFSNRVYGDGTKYKDYYQGIGMDPKPTINAIGFQKISSRKLLRHANEKLDSHNDEMLFDSMFFDKNGFRRSAYYPY